MPYNDDTVKTRFQQLSGRFDSSMPGTANYKVCDKTVHGALSFTGIIYEVDDCLNVPALIIRPSGKPLRRLAIALHQSTRPPDIGKEEPAGLGGRASLQYGRELGEYGFGVICPDYPGYGAYRIDQQHIYGELGYESVTAKALRNHIVAISVLSSFLEVSAQDVAAIGHSLGGSNAIFLAMFDSRISHIVCSAGFSDFRSYAEKAQTKDLSGWARTDKYMPLIGSNFKLDHTRMPIDFGEMIGSLAPKHLFCSLPQRDDQFDFEGARRASLEAARMYERAGCGDRFVIATPDCEHDFPDSVRRKAYSFLGCALTNS